MIPRRAPKFDFPICWHRRNFTLPWFAHFCSLDFHIFYADFSIDKSRFHEWYHFLVTRRVAISIVSPTLRGSACTPLLMWTRSLLTVTTLSDMKYKPTVSIVTRLETRRNITEYFLSFCKDPICNLKISNATDELHYITSLMRKLLRRRAIVIAQSSFLQMQSSFGTHR